MAFQLFTWEFMHAMMPQSVTVLAESKSDAIERILACARDNKVLWLCGPYTEKRNIQAVLATGVDADWGKKISLEDYLNAKEPRVHPVDHLIHHTALDG